jgi:crossover junction endodeoxyribonuclease RusA
MNDTEAIKIVFYDIPPAELRGNSRAHWKTIRRVNRERRDLAKWLALEQLQGRIPFEKCTMIIDFYHNRKIDYDNLHIGFKSSLDGIVDSGLVPDDNPEVLDVELKFHKCKKGESKTVVTFIPMREYAIEIDSVIFDRLTKNQFDTIKQLIKLKSRAVL